MDVHSAHQTISIASLCVYASQYRVTIELHFAAHLRQTSSFFFCCAVASRIIIFSGVPNKQQVIIIISHTVCSLVLAKRERDTHKIDIKH